MPADLVVPQLGESISEGEILAWRKADGDSVAIDEILVELETDKTTVELPSPAAGILRIVKPQGSVVAVGDVLGRIEEGAAKTAPKAAAKREAAAAPPASSPAPAASSPAPAAEAPAPAASAPPPAAAAAESSGAAARLGPAARRLAEERGVDAASLRGSGPGGRATKGDVTAAADAPREA
ncbi:MAG: biotin/lipoyl-containing protein, partial [Candidatus Binatia bacterium]